MAIIWNKIIELRIKLWHKNRFFDIPDYSKHDRTFEHFFRNIELLVLWRRSATDKYLLGVYLKLLKVNRIEKLDQPQEYNTRFIFSDVSNSNCEPEHLLQSWNIF